MSGSCARSYAAWAVCGQNLVNHRNNDVLLRSIWYLFVAVSLGYTISPSSTKANSGLDHMCKSVKLMMGDTKESQVRLTFDLHLHDEFQGVRSIKPSEFQLDWVGTRRVVSLQTWNSSSTQQRPMDSTHGTA